MTSIEGKYETLGGAMHCLDEYPNSDSGDDDRSISSEDESMIHQDPETDIVEAAATRCSRRVCFIDTVSISGPIRQRELVTRTAYRPSTTAEEKHLLYYSSQDYAFFALEDYYYKIEKTRHQSCRAPKVLGWEDCMVYEGDYEDELCAEEETTRTLRKVKTYHELQL
mmetsp:Transcript_20390/g.33062  ORF Transcript_20390/g.33062 Transcript_20390/m.33062 type:complete len:167 (+) Transcript_20390:144-644(+)|eukprot:CAMPEP_0196145408 /NCGR_PEP_ID=MMETSP0910-20130528/20188_1 /TAXON_ID=49265 /ORGANISM="Thalassiosira rotula, Strain GSO102" /LENGTH=166 /DNA_ID=CAMNT_0041407347 /DNA_START=140 /DNA_END=640 /DNA_ORIENTATION=+